MQRFESAVEYLTKEANIAIKYRLTKELHKETGSIDFLKLKRKLEESERAKKLLKCLINRKEYHGATLQAVENSLNMLIDMGFMYETGFNEFDKAVIELVHEVQQRKMKTMCYNIYQIL